MSMMAGSMSRVAVSMSMMAGLALGVLAVAGYFPTDTNLR
jgi:hypothetical protein